MGDSSVFEVSKVTDPRLVQAPHTFTALQGAAAISNVAVTAASGTNTSTLTFSIIPPSPQVVIQKSPMLDLDCVFAIPFEVGAAGGTAVPNPIPVNSAFAVWGRDFGLCRSLPLGQVIQSYNLQINNAATQQQNVSLPDLAHVLETPYSRAGKGTTSRTPLYASWDDANGTTQAIGSVADLQGEGDIGPGGFDIQYCLPNGNPLDPNNGTQQTYLPAFPGAVPITYVNGQPIVVAANQAAGAISWVYIRIRLIDTVMCSPFGFSYADTFNETGMYGISSMLINATVATTGVRLFQCSTANGCWISNNPAASPQLIQFMKAPQIWMTYLSPPITSTLPPRSIVSLCNLQYFQQRNFGVGVTPASANGGPLPPGQVTFSSVTFSNVPDVFIISVRPDVSTQLTNETDWSCTFYDAMFSQFTFANMSGQFAGWAAHTLQLISRQNGSTASVSQYGSTSGSGYFMSGGKRCIAGGAPIIIRPGKDFPLPTGVSVGSTGQCQLNFTLNFNAPGCAYAARNFVCTVTALSTGFFITDSGVSRQVLVGLDEATVLSAPDGGDSYSTSQLVGGNRFLKSLGVHVQSPLMRAHASANSAMAARDMPGGWAGSKRVRDTGSGMPLASRLTA